MLKIFLSLMLSLIAVGCGPRYVDYFPCHDDGTVKPHIAFIPIIDSSCSGLPWNLSEELTEECRYMFRDNGELFLFSLQEIEGSLSKMGNIDYFGQDISYAKNFPSADFVVVAELVEHQVVPYVRGKIYPLYSTGCRNCNKVLLMKVKVRVIDVRNDEPHIVLQECIQSNHMIPRNQEDINYNINGRGSSSYCTTPYAMAHQRFVCEFVNRFESLIGNVR